MLSSAFVVNGNCDKYASNHTNGVFTEFQIAVCYFYGKHKKINGYIDL